MFDRRNNSCKLKFLVRPIGLVLWGCLCGIGWPDVVAGDDRSSQQISGNERQNDQVLAGELNRFVIDYCIDCHGGSTASAGLDLLTSFPSGEKFEIGKLDFAIWEKVIRRLETRQMPPADASRPDEDEYEAAKDKLAELLQRRSDKHPKLARVGAMRRLTRFEYQNAIRDLLGVQVDASRFLPADEASQGFDNITVEELSPVAIQRYLSAAQKISRVAIGSSGDPIGLIVRLPPDRSQENHVPGLPLGTRGGTLIHHQFHQSGEYEIEIKLSRDRDEKVEGLNRKHHLDLLVDRKRVKRFELTPPGSKGSGWRQGDFTHADSHLKTRFKVPAGRHAIGVTFPKTFSSLVENKRQPFDTNFNRHRHPRKTPAVFQVSIVGPFAGMGPGETRSRKLIFGEVDASKGLRKDAVQILKRLAARAFRRPITDVDLAVPLKLFDQEFAEASPEQKDRDQRRTRFEEAIEMALASILVNPNFLFKVELDRSPPETTNANSSLKKIRPLTGPELATRLSFFLWSSIPDKELADLARRGPISESDLEAQVRRMLQDPKSEALSRNFVGQWLEIRKLNAIQPDLRLFPDFDDNLRQAFLTESQLLFEEILKSDQGVEKLIRPQYSFLNARLAQHYGISGIAGSEFRKVNLANNSKRGGLLRHGSVLTATSYATRTSPTLRGNWVLDRIYGMPSPPPPNEVPNLKEKSTLVVDSVRERLARHRADPSCAVCHDRIDPLGFAFENYDAVGRWREFEGTADIDSSGVMPSGQKISSVTDLENVILKRPQVFATAITEKLMTYALGRPLGPGDGPYVRRVVEKSRRKGYALSDLVAGIVLSKPFRMRSLQ